MRVKILNKDHFSIKPLKSLSTLEQSTDVRVYLPYKKLVFADRDTEIAKYEDEQQIFFEEYEDRLICYLQQEKTKQISFEVFSSSDHLNSLKNLLVSRNNKVNYKSPLLKDPSTQVQESMLICKNQKINLKGFFNLILIFLCLNYIRLIAESRTKERSMFLENVILIA